MPISRLLKPNADETFYHYCSVDTFKAICENKNLRFSDINMLNDYQEWKWGYRIFEESASEILNDELIRKRFPGLGIRFFDRVDEFISPIQFHSHPIISSFSKDPDVLSQWRAYADNGRGFAIGFSGAVLEAMPVTILDVQYDKEEQIKEMKHALLDLYEKSMSNGGLFNTEFGNECVLLAFWMLGFKNPAFAEEKEIRCLHALAVRTDGNRPRLVDEGGFSGKRKVKGEKVKYRVDDGAIVAYVDIPLPIIKGLPLIKEVWTGPRNVNGPGNIAYLMSECGLTGYAVHNSAASHR